MANVKLKDVAEAAGVSISTASLVLNGKGQLSQDVRERVLEAAKTLEYSKGLVAPGSSGRYASHVAILVSEDPEKAFVWNFVRRIIIQLETVMTEAGYCAVIIPVSLSQEPQDILEKILISNAKALFSIDYGNQELFQKLEEQNIPVVVVNNSAFQNQFSSVCVDDFHGAYEGARHLLDLGHRRIAYLEYHRPDMPALIYDRFVGFKKALDEAEINFPKSCRISVDLYDLEELYNKLQSLMQHAPPPSAIFAHDDYLAAQILMELQCLGIRVPDDISIIAPGDTLDYHLPFTPQISTISINNELMGKLAGGMMLERFNQAERPLHVLKVNQQLVKRGSCARLPREELE